jgi:hypothetical protein
MRQLRPYEPTITITSTEDEATVVGRLLVGLSATVVGLAAVAVRRRE